jgi:Protein of unknown function (DUF1570)
VYASLLLAALLASGSGGLATDRVELKSGRTLRGRVLYEDGGVVVLKEEHRTRTIEADEVRSVVSRERLEDELLDRMGTLAKDELAEQVDLASRAREVGLEGEAEILLLRVVLTDPMNEPAREALGHRRFGSSWRAPFKGDWLPLLAVAEKRRSWADAWEFETAHYHLLTNVDLPTALDTALDLEIAYRAFHEVFGRSLGLHHVEERLEAHVHGDAASLPALDPGVVGIFDEATNTLIVDASYRLDRGLLFHEATHQVVHNTHAGMRAGAPGVPLWLDEGLAEFMQVGLAVKPRTYRFAWGEISEDHLRAHLLANPPYTLDQVLALRTQDFRTSRSSLSYAMAYTLVEFCMNADSGIHQDDFLAYLSEAYTRRVEPADFIAIVAKEPAAFEQAWNTYVEEFMHDPLRLAERRGRRGR